MGRVLPRGLAIGLSAGHRGLDVWGLKLRQVFGVVVGANGRNGFYRTRRDFGLLGDAVQGPDGLFYFGAQLALVAALRHHVHMDNRPALCVRHRDARFLSVKPICANASPSFSTRASRCPISSCGYSGSDNFSVITSWRRSTFCSNPFRVRLDWHDEAAFTIVPSKTNSRPGSCSLRAKAASTRVDNAANASTWRLRKSHNVLLAHCPATSETQYPPRTAARPSPAG